MVKLDNKNSSSVREFEQWVRSELHGTNKQPSHEQPASAPVSEWSYDYDGDRYHIRAVGNDDCVAHADKLKDAVQIVEDHNHHQHCATQLQYLGNRAEELSSLLAGMTTERDWFKAQCENLQEEVRIAAVDARVAHEQNKRLREVLRQAREQIEFLEQALEEYHGSRQPNPALDAIDAALSHAEQAEGSDAG